MFSSHKLYKDWCVAEPDEDNRANVKWLDFIKSMMVYYKPTENVTLKHFHFCTIAQQQDEMFSRFCNRVESEAKHCHFKCSSAACTAESTAVQDQIIIWTTENNIRDEALKQSLNKLGKYSKMRASNNQQPDKKKNPITCYNSGSKVSGSSWSTKRKAVLPDHTSAKCAKTLVTMKVYAKVRLSSK